GHCPALLRDLLHTRELGLLQVTTHFGKQAWQVQTRLDLVIQLQNKAFIEHDGLKPRLTSIRICRQDIPTLTLSIQNPASLIHRIQTAVSLQSTMQKAEIEFKLNQKNTMAAK
ncbi:MAG: serine kinase of HPr protein (carbohydrate metabolism regulator), partial [Methylophagaceae bacterium]